MNIFLEPDELKEIKPLEPTEDNGVVINPEVGKRGEAVPEVVKEIVALDAMLIGPLAASEIHGVPQSSASKYAQGKDVGPDARAVILSRKYDIEDLATMKLMDTLNLIDPSDVKKTKDKIALMNGLSNLVGKITSDKGDNDVKQVHLHLYAPNQKKETEYATIDV